jgi:hypothetical protein
MMITGGPTPGAHVTEQLRAPAVPSRAVALYKRSTGAATMEEKEREGPRRVQFRRASERFRKRRGVCERGLSVSECSACLVVAQRSENDYGRRRCECDEDGCAMGSSLRLLPALLGRLPW